MQTFNLDLSQKSVIPLLYAKQRDVGLKICVVLTDNQNAYNIPENTQFSVWFSGKSGSGNYTEIDGNSAFVIEGNTITVELIYQMLNNPGEHLMCLVMNGADGKQQGLWNIPYFVEAIPGANSEAATAYYNAFLDAQKKAEEAADRAAAAAGELEDVKPKDVIVTAEFEAAIPDPTGATGAMVANGTSDLTALEIATAIRGGATVKLIDNDNIVYEYDGYLLEPSNTMARFKAEVPSEEGIKVYRVNIDNELYAGRVARTIPYNVDTALRVSYAQPNEQGANVWLNPCGGVGASEISSDPSDVSGIVGLVLNEILNNTAVRYATITDALSGASATADGKVLAYTCAGKLNIMLLDDIASTIAINITKNCTLHLNGKKLSFTAPGAFLNINTASEVTINGEVVGSEITMTLTNGTIEKLISVTNTTLHMIGGKYSAYGTYSTAIVPVRAENANTKITMFGCTIHLDVSASVAAYGAQTRGAIECHKCTLNVTSQSGPVCAVNSDSTTTEMVFEDCKISATSFAERVMVGGVRVVAGNCNVTNCHIEADGWSDLEDENGVVQVYGVYPIMALKSTQLTINGGYYWGARDAMITNGTARINGGVYEGCQHGGAYMCGSDIKAKNATFRCVEYAGKVGWRNNFHGAALYCGDSNNADVNVHMDNCRFETNTAPNHGIVAKYSGSEVFLSNCVIDGNFGNDLRADTGNTIYIGKNVVYEKVSASGGTIDTTTYADQEFGFETEDLVPNAVLSMKDERGNWVAIV